VVSFLRMVRTTSGLGEARYALGDRLVDLYLEFAAGRARPNTLRAVAFDLKTFIRSRISRAASTAACCDAAGEGWVMVMAFSLRVRERAVGADGLVHHGE
jgi:hypothetical protein